MCFGRSFRPSSGVQDCTYSYRHLSNRYSCLLASKQTAVSVWQMLVAVCTVLNSWWRTERSSETCRVSLQNKINFWYIGASNWFYYRNSLHFSEPEESSHSAQQPATFPSADTNQFIPQPPTYFFKISITTTLQTGHMSSSSSNFPTRKPKAIYLLPYSCNNNNNNNNNNMRRQNKHFLVQAMKACKEGRGIYPPILSLGTRWKWLANFWPRLLYSR